MVDRRIRKALASRYLIATIGERHCRELKHTKGRRVTSGVELRLLHSNVLLRHEVTATALFGSRERAKTFQILWPRKKYVETRLGSNIAIDETVTITNT